MYNYTDLMECRWLLSAYLGGIVLEIQNRFNIIFPF